MMYMSDASALPALELLESDRLSFSRVGNPDLSSTPRPHPTSVQDRPRLLKVESVCMLGTPAAVQRAFRYMHYLEA